MINLVVAIPCEARPLIRHLRLQKQANMRSYDLFCRDDLRLIVSGVGKLAAASACAWLQGMSEGCEHPAVDAWLNIGIAGHGSLDVGSAALAHRISEPGGDRSWYPGFASGPACPSSALITVERPETRYDENTLYDMEASGFYACCSRFCTIELIHCFKVVSDNPGSGIDSINEIAVTKLIEAQLPTIDSIIEQLRRDCQQLSRQHQPAVQLEACLQRWRFSHYQRLQLQRLLLRRQCLIPEQQMWLPEFNELENAAQVLAYLQQQLDQLPVRFRR